MRFLSICAALTILTGCIFPGPPRRPVKDVDAIPQPPILPVEPRNDPLQPASAPKWERIALAPVRNSCDTEDRYVRALQSHLANSLARRVDVISSAAC